MAAATIVGCAAPPERRPDAGRLMSELMSGRHQIGGAFTLWDASGRRVRLADFQGRLVLLYFGFARCPDVCPTDLALIAQALERLGARAEAVQPIFVTLDPARDTPEVLREYVAAFHPRFVALTGSDEDVREVATSFKVYYEKVPLAGRGAYTIDHTAYTFLLDRRGDFVILFPPGTPAERMEQMIVERLNADR